MPPASRFEQVALLSPAPERSPTASRSAASKGEDPAVPHLKHFSDGWRVWNPMIRNYVGDATRTAFADQGQASELMRAIYAEMAAAGVGPKRVTAKAAAMRSSGPDLFGAVVAPRSVGEQVGFKFNGRTWRTRGDGWWFSGPYAINLELRPAGSHGRVMGAFVLYREGREVSRHNLLAEAQAAVPGEQVAFKANGLPLDPYHATIARAVAARKPWSCEVRDWGGPSFRVDAKPAPGNDWQISVANDPGNRGAYFGAEQELGERGVQRLIVEAVDHDLGMVAHEVARLRGDPKANPFVVADRQGHAVIPAVFDSRTDADLARRYLEASEGEGGLRVRTSTTAENVRGRKRNGAHRTPPKGSLIHAEILAGGYGDTVDPAARVLRFTAIQPPEGYGKRMHSPRYEINELVADAAGAQVARSGKKAVGVVFRGVDRTGSGAAEAAQAVAALSQRLHGDPRALRAQVSHGKRNDLGRRLPPPPPPPSFDTYAYGRPVYADEARESRPRRRSVEDYEAISMLKPNGRRPRDMATLDLFAAPAQPRLLPDAGRPRMATVEDLATAPLGSLLLTSDRHVAYRHATPGKAGWISQMPSASSPDGWKQRGGGQPPGLRLFRVLTDMMARESFYLAPPVFTAAKHNPAGQLPATVERCVAKVAPRRVDTLGAREGLSSAIAICTAQGQRQGTLRKGTRTPTTRGKAAQRSARRRKGFAEAERAVGRMAREASKENSVRNRRVNITPGAPEEHAVYGTLKTVHGVEVVEVHPRFYQSPDLRFCVRQLADEHCNSPTRGRWIVEDEKGNSSSDLIPTKREAFEVLRETQRETQRNGA